MQGNDADLERTLGRTHHNRYQGTEGMSVNRRTNDNRVGPMSYKYNIFQKSWICSAEKSTRQNQTGLRFTFSLCFTCNVSSFLLFLPFSFCFLFLWSLAVVNLKFSLWTLVVGIFPSNLSCMFFSVPGGCWCYPTVSRNDKLGSLRGPR